MLGRAGEPKEDRRCKAGVAYDDVKQSTAPGRGWLLPCLGHHDTECALYEAVTAEQEAANTKQAYERLKQAAEVIAAGKCPHCGQAMTQQTIGHCLYATPCGHRLNAIPSVIRGLS